MSRSIRAIGVLVRRRKLHVAVSSALDGRVVTPGRDAPGSEAELLLYLGELDQRRLYREEVYASAFEFCISRLGYSEDVAYKRVGAARLMRQFPRIYDLLAEGRIHLTALMLLKPYLKEENHQNWLFAACNKSKREVEILVASRCPKQYLSSDLHGQ